MAPRAPLAAKAGDGRVTGHATASRSVGHDDVDQRCGCRNTLDDVLSNQRAVHAWMMSVAAIAVKARAGHGLQMRKDETSALTVGSNQQSPPPPDLHGARHASGTRHSIYRCRRRRHCTGPEQLQPLVPATGTYKHTTAHSVCAPPVRHRRSLQACIVVPTPGRKWLAYLPRALPGATARPLACWCAALCRCGATPPRLKRYGPRVGQRAA